MKLIRNKNYLFFVLFGIVSILLGAVERLQILPATGGTPGLSQIIVGIIFLAAGLYLSRKPESEVVIDERIRKRDMKVYTGAFLAVLIYVTFLALMDVLWSANLIDLGDFFLIFPRPDIKSIFSRYMSIIGVAIISVAALRVYFNRKSDV
jgi:LPXTG-motif cell wall-anchored protein